ASLLLECFAALALALLLSGARFSPVQSLQHLVVLLDDSASMAAADTRGETARDRAVRRVLAEVEPLGRTARVTLIQSGERPAVLCGPAASLAEARAALDAWKPQASHHEMALSLRMARELAGKDGRLLILSDVLPPQPVANALWVAAGKSLPNVGIVAAQRTLTPETGKASIALSLANFADAPVRRRLRVLAGANEVLARDLDISPGPSSLTLPISPGLPALRVEISADALLRDNEVFLVEPRPAVVGVENKLPPGRGRSALDKALAAIPRVTRAQPGHLVFTAAEPPQPMSSSWRVSIGGAGKGGDFAGPFVPEKRHPLLQGVTLAGVVWSGAAPLPAGGVQPLLTAGDVPLIAMRGARPEAGLVLNLDLERSNLIRSPDWPILIVNLVEWRRQHLPGPERWNYHAGEWVRAHLAREPKGPLRLQANGFERTLPPGRTLEFLAPVAAGVCRVLDGNETLFELGVSFLDERESDLRDRRSGEAGAFAAGTRGLRAEDVAGSDPLFWILLALAAAALLANWTLAVPVTRA
ncbi:MAG: VWA domain-containing protein, partial [Verrucomicrobiia bacterium]